MMKQIKAVQTPEGNGKFQRRAPLRVSPEAKKAIELYIKAESSFNRGTYTDRSGFTEAAAICQNIVEEHSYALADGHSKTLVDAYLLLAKSLWHLGQDKEALIVLSTAGKMSSNPEISVWERLCRKK